MGCASTSSYFSVKKNITQFLFIFVTVFLFKNIVHANQNSVVYNSMKASEVYEYLWMKKMSYGLGGALWSESFNLLKTGGNIYPLKSNVYAASLLLSKNYYFLGNFWAWQWAIYAGQMNISQDTTNLSYFKRGSNLVGTSVGTHYYFFENNNIKLGLGMDVLYRYGLFVNPDTQSVFESKHLITGLASFVMDWRLNKKWMLEQKIASATSLRDSFWQISIFWLR